MNFRRYWQEISVTVLLLLNVFIWFAVYQKEAFDKLSVYFLDVGQGDAILIDSPSHNRVLIDGGPNRKVLSELGRIMPFADRRIDVVVETHPDKDHIGGLPEVVDRYQVGLFIEPGVRSDNSVDGELEKRLEQKGIPRILARKGMVVNLGDGVKLQVLFPAQDVSNWETNRASIVAKLVYGEKSFLLTGDSPIAIEDVLLATNPEAVDADVLKVGHHGSRTSTSISFAQAVSPEYSVISAGRDNAYGHPHEEVLDILGKAGSKVLSTFISKTIIFETDGESMEVK